MTEWLWLAFSLAMNNFNTIAATPSASVCLLSLLTVAAASGCGVFDFLSPKVPDNPAAGNGQTSGDGNGPALREDMSTDELHDGLRAWVAAMDNKLISQEAPLPAADLEKLEQYRALLAKGGADAASFYAAHLLTFYNVENAWRGETTSSAAAIAKLVGANVAEEGSLAAGSSVNFAAIADKCYFIFSHAEAGTKDHLTFHGKAGDTPLLRFHVTPRTITKGSTTHSVTSASVVSGFCATKNTAIAATTQAKDGNGSLRYVIVETPRASFSEYIAALVQVHVPDWCDVANWEQLWLNPIPGSLVYAKKGAYLTYRIDGVGENWLTGLDAEVRERRFTASDMKSTASHVSFAKAPRFKGCSRRSNPHASQATQRIAQCYQRLDSRYEPKFDAARQASKNATTVAGKIAANRTFNALREAKKREAKRCQQLEAQVHKKMAGAYRRIADHFGGGNVSLQFDRAAAHGKFVEGS